jgi:hypothetical protein
MPPEASIQLLKRIASRIQPGSEVRGICYEMCVAGDEGGEGGNALGESSAQDETRQQMQSEGTGDVSKFGKVMLANLEVRNAVRMPDTSRYALTDAKDLLYALPCLYRLAVSPCKAPVPSPPPSPTPTASGKPSRPPIPSPSAA